MRVSIKAVFIASLTFGACGREPEKEPTAPEGETRADDASDAVVIAAPPAPSGASAFQVLSDLDDTLKVSNSASSEVLVNSLFSNDAFAGMAVLMRALKEHGATRTSLLSGTPSLIEKRVLDFLAVNDFPAPERTVLRSSLGEFADVATYKLAAVRTIEAATPEPFLFFGDDVEQDAEVYASFAQEKAAKVVATYIHRVTGRAVPSGVRVYVTAFEVAVWEMAAGRLDAAAALAVGTVVVAAADELILPDFVNCPAPDFDPLAGRALSTELQDRYAQIKQRIARICAAR